MLKLLIFLIVLYFVYRHFKNKKLESLVKEDALKKKELCECSLCKKFVDCQKGIEIIINGEKKFFCSKECAEKFLKERQ